MKRFFFHYNKRQEKMTIHWDGLCHLVDDIYCKVPTETKWSKRQPRIVMRGYAKEVILKNGKAFIL